MSSIIKVTPDSNGRVIIKLYGQDYDVTNLADGTGKGSFKKFGEQYSFEIVPKTRQRIQKVMTESRTEEKADEN